MHGIIHLELQQFVQQHFGEQAWQKLVRAAGLEQEIYTPLRAYPDSHVVRLVHEAERMTQLPASELLEQFGEYLVPTYLRIYGALLKPSWRTLEVLEHTEETIHRVVRTRQPGALPPRLTTRRTGAREVHINYESERRLCAVARGIVRGVAGHFGQKVKLRDLACMHRGDPSCVIAVQLLR